MANEEQLAILKQGVDVWNEWRQNNPFIKPDLSETNLRYTNLQNANFNNTNLQKADLTETFLRDAQLAQADLREAIIVNSELSYASVIAANLAGAVLLSSDLRESNFWRASFEGANLEDAYLLGANLGEADFTGANLTGANLTYTRMIRTQLYKADLSNCQVFGISAWNVKLDGATQWNLIITDHNEPKISVDNLEIAQFIYLLLHNEKLRDVIDTIGKKAVLILGRFTDERKVVLEAIRQELRQRDYIPILFDFEKPDSRDLTETISTLAHLSRFVIADLTDAKSIPQELSVIVPNLPSVAVQPVILKNQRPYGMFEHWQRFASVLPIHEYESQDQLIADLSDKIIAPAEAKVIELRPNPK